VVDAVILEPVSTAPFPANRENYSENEGVAGVKR
jgi:hypothetical protein